MAERVVPAVHDEPDVVVDVEDLRVDYRMSAFRWGSGQTLAAVRGVSFQARRGEVLAIVGESGCGKSSVVKTLVGLEVAAGGSIRFRGCDVSGMSSRERRAWRRQVGMVFQDPYASLNPRLRVEQIIAEPLKANSTPRGDRARRVSELLSMVGLGSEMRARFPGSLSGGQRQRVSIARALALDPPILIADEPVSALDVSAQAQILNLLSSLQTQLGLSILLVTHDLWMVHAIADQVAVMYLGHIVELGPARDVFSAPRHPYTEALLNSAPTPDPVYEKAREQVLLEGEVPSPLDPPTGCHFHPRCPYVMDRCRHEEPQVFEAQFEHVTKCFLADPSVAASKSILRGVGNVGG